VIVPEEVALWFHSKHPGPYDATEGYGLTVARYVAAATLVELVLRTRVDVEGKDFGPRIVVVDRGPTGDRTLDVPAASLRACAGTRASAARSTG
jgi:Golgi phosphoprotein 3 (GPP34)